MLEADGEVLGEGNYRTLEEYGRKGAAGSEVYGSLALPIATYNLCKHVLHMMARMRR